MDDARGGEGVGGSTLVARHERSDMRGADFEAGVFPRERRRMSLRSWWATDAAFWAEEVNDRSADAQIPPRRKRGTALHSEKSRRERPSLDFRGSGGITRATFGKFEPQNA